MPIPEYQSRSSPPPNLASSLFTEISQSKVLDSFFVHPSQCFAHSQLPADDVNVLSVLAYAVNYLGVENGAFSKKSKSDVT